MQLSQLYAMVLTSSLVNALAAPANVARAENEMQVTFWVDGCQVSDCDSPLGCSQTYRFAENIGADEIGFSAADECVPAPNYQYQQVSKIELGTGKWTVDLFSGEGCNNFVRTIDIDGCYVQPVGQIVLSARARPA